MNKVSKLMSQLVTLAADVPAVSRAKLCAAVVYRGRVVAYGTNQLKSHSFQQRFSSNEHSLFLHAETDAIKNSLKRIDLKELSHSKLLVARVKYQDGSLVWGLAKPCKGCQKAIATFGISKVYYTTNEGLIERLA